jgi:hypothetical protein
MQSPLIGKMTQLAFDTSLRGSGVAQPTGKKFVYSGNTGFRIASASQRSQSSEY